MDIGNLNSAYADIYSAKQNQTASKLENQLSGNYANKTDDELMDACKEFEAYFLEMMFKEMMKTVPRSDSGSSYGASVLDYYQDAFIQEISKQSTEDSSLGLAQTLYEQMKRNYSI